MEKVNTYLCYNNARQLDVEVLVIVLCEPPSLELSCLLSLLSLSHGSTQRSGASYGKGEIFL
jgi:hypothetical protein